jgi:transposase InsO family protein
MKRMGRPATSPSKRFQARLKVARALREQGFSAGWRPVLAKVGSEVSTRLVQESLRKLKKRHRIKLAKRFASRRVHVEVLSPNVIWAQDATHLGRMGRKAVQAEVIKDRATLGYTALAVGPAAKADEILWMLRATKEQEGLPLVWATDNGSAYRDKRVEDFLKQEKVVHLLSRPRLPQDNAAAEKGIQELKVEAKLGRGTCLAGTQEAVQKLAYSREILNTGRLRASKGYRTAEQLKASLPSWEEKISRGAFYERACEAKEKGVKGGGTKRQKRQAEREAVYETLEQFQLITRTRGGQPFKLVPTEMEDIL